MNYFHPYVSRYKYVQDDENICCFITLEYSLYDTREYVVELTIVLRLKSYLFCKYFGYRDRIKFSNDIIIDKVRNKGEHHCHYELVQLVVKYNLVFSMILVII